MKGSGKLVNIKDIRFKPICREDIQRANFSGDVDSNGLSAFNNSAYVVESSYLNY